MSDETVVEADGVRVTKSFDAEGFPVPAVRFDVESTRDDETTLTITDEIPDEFDIDQIGFHPEYGSDHWTATGDGIVRFERAVEAGESFTTVYGVRMNEDESPEAFLESPTIAVGDETPGTGIEDVVPPESSDIVRELAGGKRDTIPGLEEEPPATEAEASETHEPVLDALHADEGEIVDADAVEPAVSAHAESGATEEPATEPEPEPTVAEVAAGDTEPAESAEAEVAEEATAAKEAEEAEAAEAAEAAEEAEESKDAAETPSPEPEPVAEEPGEAVGTAEVAPEPAGIQVEDLTATLADQIRNGDVDDDDLDVLRDELAPKRSSVQLEHLQSRVSEMEAYADALGAFIDENGDARGILEDLQSDVESVQETVQKLESTVNERESALEDLETSMSDVQSKLDDIDAVESRIDRVAGDVDALDERVGGVEESVTTVEDLADDIADIRDELAALKEWRDQLSNVFGGA